MSKSQVKGGKSAKDVLTKVKSGGVSKAVNGKAKSKGLTQKIVQKEQKTKKAVKPPTPSDSEESDSESESEAEIKKPVATGKTNGVKSAVKESSEIKPVADDDSASDDDDSDASSDDSESEAEKPTVSAVMGDKISKDDDDDDSESEESDSEDEKPAAKQAPKANGVAKDESDDDSEEDSDEDSSDDSESDAEASAAKPAAKTNGVAKVAKDVSDDDSDADSDSSDEAEEEEEKPKTTKRKADDVPERATKKAKAEADSANGPNLFVGNLSWNITEEWLREEFEQFGELSGVRLMTDRDTGRSKGFGYVEFVSAADAGKAHAAKKDVELDGRPMNVDFANAKPTDRQRQDNRSKSFGDKQNPPSDTLFLGNLPFSADTEMVTEAFEPHGSITSVRIPTDQETGRPRGFGYITFASIDEATAALEAMAGYYMDGRPVRLDFTTPRDSKGGDDSPRGGRGGFGGRGRGGFNGRGGRGGFGDRGGRGGGRGRGAPRGGRGGSTNRGGFGDFSGRKTTF